jgi:hypothetical protein
MTDAPSDRSSLTTWPEPQDDWLPIACAVFRFAIAQSDGPEIAETLQDRTNPLIDYEAFEKFKDRLDKCIADMVRNQAAPLSLHNLRTTLRDKARARRAEIDLDEGYFRFGFDAPAGGSAVMSFAPWHLALPRDPARIDPQLLARFERDALFNKGDGPHKVGDEEAALSAQQCEAAHTATSFVWNQLMLPVFDRLVSAGRVTVYARARERDAPFRQLPHDIWTNLKVVDWLHGTACDPEGVRYYSIHAADGLPKVSPPHAEALADHALVLPKSRRPGREKGQGSFEQLDQPLLSKMKALITDMKAASPEEAARMVAPEAHGSGTPESKAERLARRFRKARPD